MSDALDWRARERNQNAAIAHSLREQRLTLGVLQAQVASHLGLAESTFSRHESGQRIVSAAMLCAIASYLRSPITSILPPELVGSGITAATDDVGLTRIMQTLSSRPDLILLVEGLLETVLAEAHEET